MKENYRNILIFAFVLFGLGVVYLATSNNSPIEQNEELPLLNEKEKAIKNSVQENEAMETMIMGDPTSLVALLEDVNGGDSSGTAYVLRKDDSLMHILEATMPKPAEGSVYEGWLVNQNTGDFFSTGVAKELDEGKYKLEYSDDEIREDYNFVVITEETEVDEIPEIHILEGLAEIKK
jgi:hypothetical protein